MSEKSKPTEEQAAIVDHFRKGNSFKISAFAGSGKTSTLKLLGEKYPKTKCCYLAFNRIIADEAKSKFPKNVHCQTFHSLAFHSVPKFLSDRTRGGQNMPRSIARDFRLFATDLPLKQNPQKTGVLTEWDQGMVLIRAVDNFCRSSDKQLKVSHVIKALPKWADMEKSFNYASQMVSAAQTYWEMCTNPKYDFKISHDVYLKYWSLQTPIIPADTILLDEAQDADPIMLNILKSQDSQIVLVGDKYQQIYEFRGATNAMQSVRIPEFYLTKSFRFGQEIADVANLVLNKILGEKKRIVGNELISSSVDIVSAPDAILARTNASAFEMALACAQSNIRPKVEVDAKQIIQLIDDCEKLQAGKQVTTNSPFFGFDSWGEVEMYVEFNEQADFAPFVRLVQKSDIQMLRHIVSNMANPSDYDVVILTAHKSKGMQYNKVQLLGDFKYSLDPDKEFVTDDEARLIYVAGTRAIETLDISEMQDFYNMARILR